MKISIMLISNNQKYQISNDVEHVLNKELISFSVLFSQCLFMLFVGLHVLIPKLCQECITNTRITTNIPRMMSAIEALRRLQYNRMF